MAGRASRDRTGVETLERILTERRQKWESEQRAKFAAVKKEPPKDGKEVH